MDFAEFSDIETMSFATHRQNLQEQFSKDIEKEIINVHVEHKNSIYYRAGRTAKAFPLIGTLTIFTDEAIEMVRTDNKVIPDRVSNNIYQRVIAKFSDFLDKVGEDSITIKSMIQTLNIKLRAAETGILEKDLEIKNLKITLKKLQESMEKENEEVQRTLNLHPQVNDIMKRPYANNLPWRTLSNEQQAISRLILEIQKLNSEMRITKGQNLHLKNNLKQLQKKYDARVILESDFDEMVEDNFLLEEQNEQLKKDIKELKGKNKKDCKEYELALEELRLKIKFMEDNRAEIKKKNSIFHSLFFKNSLLGDLYDIFKAIKDFEKGITLFFYNICLIVCIINFGDAFTRRTMASKMTGFMYFPIILILLFLIIKRTTERKN